MAILRVAPRFHRVTTVQPTGQRPELLLPLTDFAQRERQQLLGAERDAFLEFEFLLEFLAAETKGRLGSRRQVGLQVPEVRGDGGRRLGGGVGQVAKDMQVIET
jgi:hypothetical protein